MFVRRPIAQVVNVQFDDPLLLRAFHHAFPQRHATDFRKQRDNVESHLEENVSDAGTVAAVCDCRNPKLGTPRASLQCTPQCYSMISRRARWPWRAAELANNARIA